MNLIEEKYSTNSYFCTWMQQTYSCFEKLPLPEPLMERDRLTEDFVFSENGLANQYEDIRHNLWFIFDDGWDVPFGCGPEAMSEGKFGSVIPNTDRFSFCTGTPIEKLKKLNDRVKGYGWKGAGLWICAGGLGETSNNKFSKSEREKYWRERLKWSAEAGIGYWKVDWGVYDNDDSFRKQLTEWGREEAPGLIIEHAAIYMPLTGVEKNDMSPEYSGRFMDAGTDSERAASVMKYSDIIRSYDVSWQLSVPTTLDRVQSMLRIAQMTDNDRCLINCEDEPFIAAVLGCETGIMRADVAGNNSTFKLDTWNIYNYTTETVRAVKWITAFAPAFAGGHTSVGNLVLFDENNFADCGMWLSAWGDKNVRQGAPAVVARNCNLPKIVYLEQTKPYIIAGVNPTGAKSIAMLHRFSSDNRYFTPRAEVTVDHKADKPLGVFGYISSLTVEYNIDITNKHIYAQDLASDCAVDITDSVTVKKNILTVNGDMLSKIGKTANNGYGDCSEPGLVIEVR